MQNGRVGRDVPDRAQGFLMLIEPREPFSFQHTLRFILSPPALLNGRQFSPLLDHFENAEYRRVIDAAGQLVLYGVQEEKHGTSSGLRVRLLAGATDSRPNSEKDPEVRRVVGGQVERQFSTRLDLEPFYKLASSDPVLAALAAHFRGMRIPQAPTVFETVVCAIVEQQVNLSFAHQVKKAIIETYGRFVNFEGRRYYAFPEPVALAITTPRELRRLQVSGPKARYIIALSRLALDGTLDLEGLRHAEPAASYEKLMELKGVGPWTAQYVGLRALGHLDCLPADDVGLQKAVQSLYRLRKQPSGARVEKIARRWAGWRSYATFYLWLTYWEDRNWKAELVRKLRSRGSNGSVSGS